MKLTQVRIFHFRNILDSGNVPIDEQVTCLVGKNESGKTAFLQALRRLNPAGGDIPFSVPEQYPAWLEKRHRLQGKDLESEKPIVATFALDPGEISDLEGSFGKGVILNPSGITVSRKYSGGLEVGLSVSEDAFIKFVLASVEWAHGTKTEANKIKNIDELYSYGKSLQNDDEAGKKQTGSELLGFLSSRIKEGETFWKQVWVQVKKYFPKFMYFSEYSTLPYTVDINRILTAPSDQLNDSEVTARSLLRIAAAENEYLQNPDYERRKRELENVANAITEDVLKYWSQNPDLRVEPDITQRTITNQQGKNVVLDELKIRIRDARHLLSLPFSEHSTGFQWFFSFLSAFSEYEFSDVPLIILLDEPALGLHARAQADFLRFIDERLGTQRQVIYSTHSPFMVEPGKLDRVRMVEDKGREVGTIVSTDVTTTDPDTLFPLQGALGYDLVQNLFIAPHNLVVEGTSDFTYFTIISDYLKSRGRIFIDNKWSIIPVGGVDVVPSFVALLGNHLDVTVVVDGKKGVHQKLNQMASRGILHANRIITIGELLDGKSADVEDLFEVEDYLSLFNNSMEQSIRESDLTTGGPIVQRIARHLDVDRYDHGIPADYLLRNRDSILNTLSEDTLIKFEKLFDRINSTLPKR